MNQISTECHALARSAWLQLVSSKHFLPQLLQVKEEKGWPYLHRLLLSLLMFLQRFLKGAVMTDAVRRLYKGTLRVLDRKSVV